MEIPKGANEEAIQAIKEALQMLQRARELSERAGLGRAATGPLLAAQREALKTFATWAKAEAK